MYKQGFFKFYVNSIKSNIWKYYLATSLAHFSFYTPIIQLFYIFNNLTILNIATLGVVWTIVKMVLEVPSSIIADKWGRKKTMAISTIFSILTIITIIFAKSYWTFVLASILSASAYAFLSGTDVAFFYDTIKQLKKEEEFDKLWARQQIYQQIPLIIALVSSGFLYEISTLLPFKISLFFLILSFIIILSFREPKYYKPIEEINIFTHFKQAIQFISKNPHLKEILIFTLLFALGSDLSYGYGQIYLNQLELPIILFGIAYTFKSLLVTIASNLAPSLRRKFSFRNLFAFEIITITILFYIMVLTKSYIIGAMCFILIAIPHGLFGISKSSYIHKHLKSYQRATIDSMYSFFIALMFLIIEPIAGYLADISSIKLPFILVAIIMSIYCIYFVIYGRKKI